MDSWLHEQLFSVGIFVRRYAMNELGEEGYVPMTFLQAVTEDEVASAAQSAGDKRIHI